VPFDEDRRAILSAIILGVCLLIGLAVGGYFIGKGAARFKSDTRTVTVKGLVEREVKANQAIWTLNLRRASDDLKDAHAKISADRDAVLEYLKKQGFKEDEIERQAIRTIDKLAREFGEPQATRLRYVVTSSAVVKTSNIDLVRKAVGETEQLVKQGVVGFEIRRALLNHRNASIETRFIYLK